MSCLNYFSFLFTDYENFFIFSLGFSTKFLGLNSPGPSCPRADSTIHRINRYPADKCEQNVLRYPMERDLSTG